MSLRKSVVILILCPILLVLIVNTISLVVYADDCPDRDWIFDPDAAADCQNTPGYQWVGVGIQQTVPIIVTSFTTIAVLGVGGSGPLAPIMQNAIKNVMQTRIYKGLPLPPGLKLPEELPRLYPTTPPSTPSSWKPPSTPSSWKPPSTGHNDSESWERHAARGPTEAQKEAMREIKRREHEAGEAVKAHIKDRMASSGKFFNQVGNGVGLAAVYTGLFVAPPAGPAIASACAVATALLKMLGGLF